MPLPLVALAGLGAVLGGAKSMLVDAPREERQRKQAAATTRFSPWTGLQAGPIQEADPFGSVLQGATMGAMMGQSIPGLGPGGVGAPEMMAGGGAPGLGVDTSLSQFMQPQQAMMGGAGPGLGVGTDLSQFMKPQQYLTGGGGGGGAARPPSAWAGLGPGSGGMYA